MTGGGNALWESLSTETKHELAAWGCHRARRVETGLPTRSPEVSDYEDDPAMETGSDDTVPELAPVHVGFTMEQAHAHYNAAMAEEQPVSAPMPAFQRT